MSGFHEIQFPSDISYGSSGGPEFSTDVIITHSGYEQRNVNWSDARAVYNVSHGIKTQGQLDSLIAFFRARQGRAYGFRFKDWSDYNITGQQIGVGDDSTTQFQLVKQYISSPATITRSIKKPVSGTVNIYIDDVEQVSGVSVDSTTGIVTFTTPPTQDEVITADFEFDVPVRFDTDRLSASLDSYGVNSWNNIPIVEIRI
ncbi:MAG: hypothetical protein COV35_03590 [Alphaproteobacteria bacterium CG11_big_fil_rev_8_21_14_0_20_39_49]|nr:MAG: hypothetical protein COV35_03590 [Alphaproteobacteria bacterium CG11_big_fil_rev_8_21_14_0_20_39_49]